MKNDTDKDDKKKKKERSYRTTKKKFIMKHQVRNFCSANSTSKNITFK